MDVVALGLAKSDAKKNYKPLSTGPSLRRVVNLLPRPAPTVATQWFVQGYGTGGVGTASIATGQGFDGRDALQVTWTTAPTDSGSNTGPLIGTSIGDNNLYAPVSGTQPVVGSVYVEARNTTAAGYVNMQVQMTWFNSAGTQVGSYTGSPLVFARLGKRTRVYSTPIVPPATTVYASVLVRLWTANQVGTGSLLLSAPQIEEATSPGPYRDGEYGDAIWSGVRFLSPSVAMVGVTKQYAAYGDSHFGQADGGGYMVPQHLEAITGRAVYYGGRGGETITGVGVRMGAITANVTVTGGSIPTSGAVACTVTTTPTGAFRSDGTVTWPFAGQLAGIDGILQMATNGTWTFTRSATGSATAVSGAQPFQVYNAWSRVDATIIDAGNNLPDATIIASNMAAIVARCVALDQDYIILSLYNNAVQPLGDATYTLLKQINASLAATYPGHFLDTRKWLIANGLAVAGITATGQDTTDIANDVIPTSLRADSIHLNETGRRMVAALITQALWKRGLLPVP